MKTVAALRTVSHLSPKLIQQTTFELMKEVFPHKKQYAVSNYWYETVFSDEANYDDVARVFRGHLTAAVACYKSSGQSGRKRL